MKVLTDPQVNEIIRLLLGIERSAANDRTIVYAEKILGVIRQSEQVTLKFEC